MATSPAVKRIMRECKNMKTNPANGIIASPLDNNVFEWHFTIAGVTETEFEGGRYHGKIILPSEYPFKPPDLIILTKSGRFEIGRKICLNFSGFHPEHWQPSWTIRTMLVALRAFMVTPANGAVGAIETNKYVRKNYAKLSLNYICPKCKIHLNSDIINQQFKNVDKNDKLNKTDSNQNNQINYDSEDSLDLESMDDSDDNQTENQNQHNTQIENNQNQIQTQNQIETQNQNQNNNNNMSVASNSSNSSPSSNSQDYNRQDRILDYLSAAVFFIIVAILVKKFFVRFMEQL